MNPADLSCVYSLQELSAESLAENYPGLVQSVNQVMHNGDTEIRAVLEG